MDEFEVFNTIQKYAESVPQEMYQMLKQYLKTEEVNKILNDATAIDPFVNLARANAFNVAAEMPLLPKWSAVDIDEFQNIKTEVKDEFKPVIFSVNIRVIPIRDFDKENEVIKYIFGWHVADATEHSSVEIILQGVIGDIYHVKIIMNYVDGIYVREISLLGHEMFDVDWLFMRVTKTMEISNIRVDVDDIDLKHKKADVRETYSELFEGSVTVYKIPLDENEYKTVKYDYEYTRDTDTVTVPRDFKEFDIEHISGIPRASILFTLENTKIIMQNIDRPLIKKKLEDYRFKITQEGLYAAYNMQSGLYKQVKREIVETAAAESDYATDTLTSQIVIRMGEIDEILSRVSVWEDFDHDWTLGSQYAVLNFEKPIYVTREINKRMTNVSLGYRMNTSMCDYNNDADGGGMSIASIYETFKGPNSTPDFLTLFLAAEDEDVVVYVEVEGISTTGEDDHDGVNPTRSMVRAVRSNMGKVISSGGTYQGTETVVGVDGTEYGHIRVLTKESTMIVTVRAIYVCDKTATDYLRVEDATVHCTCFHGYQSMNRSMTVYQTGKLNTVEYGELYCAIFEPAITFTTDVQPAWLRVGKSGGEDTHEYLFKFDKNDKEGKTIDVDIYRDTVGEVQLTCYPNISGLPTNKAWQNIDVRCYPSTKALLTRTEYINLQEPPNLPQPSGTTWRALTGKETDRAARDNGFIITMLGSMRGQRQQPPNPLGIRKSADAFQLMQQQYNINMEYEIENILRRLTTIESRVAEIENQIKAILQTLNPSFVDMVLSQLLDVALSLVLPRVGGAVLGLANQVRKSVGGCHRIAKLAISNISSAKRGTFNKITKNTRLPISGIVDTEVFTSNLANVLKKDLTSAKKTVRPGFLNGNTTLQYIDTAEATDVLSAYMTKGRRNIAIDELVDLKPEVNKLKNALPLPIYNVYYRPLGFVNKKIGRGAHNRFTNTKNNRDRLRADSIDVSTKLPSHAFSQAEYYDVLENGTVNRHVVYMGIGELNRVGTKASDKKAGIGGVHIIYDTNMRDSKGIQMFTPKSYAECGYDDVSVERLYTTLFQKPKPSDMSYDRAWMDIAAEVDNKVIHADIMGSAYIPDPSRIEVLKNIVMSPPQFDYNLITRNCQDFVVDVMRFITDGTMPTKWSLDHQILALHERTKSAKIHLDKLGTALVRTIFGLKNKMDEAVREQQDTFVPYTKVRLFTQKR